MGKVMKWSVHCYMAVLSILKTGWFKKKMYKFFSSRLFFLNNSTVKQAGNCDYNGILKYEVKYKPSLFM